MAKSFNLEGIEESEQADFSSPASIMAFTKKIFYQLKQMDEEEKCQIEDDKRSTVFRNKIFQRFSLLFYYSHFLATAATSQAEIHSQCGPIIDQLHIASAA